MKIFEMFGEVFVKDEATKKLNTIGDGFKKFGKGVLKAGGIVAGFSLAAGTALLVLADKTAAVTDNVDKLSQQLGFSREAFQEWDFILSQNGVSIDSLKAGMKTLTNQTADLADEGDIATKAFDKIGLSFDDLEGKTQEEIFELTIKGLQEMEDVTDRAAVANDLLGRSGQELAPLLNAGSESVDLLKEKAHELNLILSDEAVDAGVVFTDTMDATKRSLQGVVNEGIAKILPELGNLAQVGVEKFQIFINKAIELKDKVVDWVTTNQPLIDSIKEKIKTFSETSVEKIKLFIDKIIEIKDKVKEWIEDNKTRIDEIKTKFQESFARIIEVIQPVLDKIKEFIDDAKEWATETDFVTEALNFVRDAINFVADALINVIDWFFKMSDWMKEHKTLVETVGIILGSLAVAVGLVAGAIGLYNIAMGIAAIATGAFTTALAILTSPITIIVAAIAAVIAIGVLIVKNWDQIKAAGIRIWGSIKTFFSNTWKSIKDAFKVAIDFIKNLFFKFTPLGIIIKNFSKIVTWFKTFGKNIKERFKAIITNAKTWGKDLIQGFVDGIKAKVAAVVNAVKNVANNVKDFLGFSVPDKGALSDADEYGGDFVDLFVNGINKAKSSLLDTVGGLSSDININANPNLQPTQAGTTGAVQGNLQPSIVQNIVFNSSAPADPLEQARQQKQAAVELAFGF